MRTMRLSKSEYGVALWCRPTDIRNWQLGMERDAAGWRGWLGPLHFAACKMEAER
jgi:hypothetical protein